MEQLENEIWKPTFVNPYYLVSNKGRIRTLDRPIWCKPNNSYSIRKGRFLKPSNNNSKGYWRIAIPSEIGNKASRREYSIHRLVATAFIPNPNDLPQINHIDGNKDNNCVENLEWCDNGYNQRHAVDMGLKNRSKMSAHSSFRKLTEEQVGFIKLVWNTVDTAKKGEKTRFNRNIMKLFGLQSENTVHWITSGGTNKFFNQDMAQTTNYDNWLSEYNRLYAESEPKKTPSDYARELGINQCSFLTKHRKLGRDINATVDFYKQYYHLQ